jgi:hypothetical protein
MAESRGAGGEQSLVFRACQVEGITSRSHKFDQILENVPGLRAV